MKIELVISTETLGDNNTTDDNARYAAAVQCKIESEYPAANVAVELVHNVTGNQIYVVADNSYEVRETVERIASQVWDREEY